MSSKKSTSKRNKNKVINKTKIADKTTTKEKSSVRKNNKLEKRIIISKNSLTILIIIILILSASLFIVVYPRYKLIRDYTYTYNGYKFTRYNNLWNMTVNHGYWQEQWVLHYSPKQVKNITVVGDFNNIFKSKNYVFLTFNPFDKNMNYIAVSAGELSIGLSRFLNKRVIPACTQQDYDACKNVPIINCSSKSFVGEPIILLKQENPPKLIFNNTCVIIQGLKADMLRAVDLFLLKYYGVM